MPIRLCALMVVSCLARAEEHPSYTPVVMRFADTFMAKGTDRYGRVHSPLWAATLDLETLSLPTQRPVIPAGPRIREGDRCWRGCNPYLDAETVRAFDELSRRTGDPKYRDAAERYLRHFLERCPSPSTGLLPWGEHAFWNLTMDAVERDTHEMLVWLPLWPEMWELNAPAVRSAIEGTYAHHVFNKKTGLFNRHASYSDARAVIGTRKGMPWIKHAGLMTYSLAFLYAKTGSAIYLARARQMAQLYWKTRDERTGLPIGCIGYAEQPGSGGISQCEALLAASAVSGLSEFRDMAVAYMKAAAKRTPKDASAARKVSWALSYGMDGGVFREAQYMLQGYRATRDADMLRYCEFCARGIMANPPGETAIAEAYGRAIRFLSGLARATGKEQYRADAHRLAKLAMDRLHHEPSGLFRGMMGYGFYDAQFGIGDLLMGLLELEDHPYTAPGAELSVDVDSPTVPSGAKDWPLRLVVENAGRRAVSARLRISVPSGWLIRPSARDFTVPAAARGSDVWLVHRGRTELTVRVTVPTVDETTGAIVPLTLSAAKGTGAWGKQITTKLAVVGRGGVISGPFEPDKHTLAIAHFDKSDRPDHLNGAEWHPASVSIVPGDGFFGGGAKFAGDAALVKLNFTGGVPREGTIEFFIRPDWTSTRTPAPASDGVVRHIFTWAPMSAKAMLWVYFLDELGAYTGARVHGPHGKPLLRRTLDFKAGQWHHLALCWRPRPDRGLSLDYFVDGARCTDGNMRAKLLPSRVQFGNEINIGSYRGCPVNGVIDELRVSSVVRYREGLMILGLEEAPRPKP